MAETISLAALKGEIPPGETGEVMVNVRKGYRASDAYSGELRKLAMEKAARCRAELTEDAPEYKRMDILGTGWFYKVRGLAQTENIAEVIGTDSISKSD